MSGRGRGRSGRGRFQGRARYPGPPRQETKTIKKSINDWNYYIGSAKQASEFEATTEFLINYIKQNFEFGNDVAKAITTQEPIITELWKPSLQLSKNTDPEIKEVENQQYTIEFKADYDLYRAREQIYNNNVTKAYALFWDRCAKGMKNKIEARSDFKEKVDNNPFELLQAIKEHSLNYQEKKYNMSVILDSIRTLIGTRQKEGEALQDYTKRFRVTREVFESHIGGPIVLTKILNQVKGYTEFPSDKKEQDNNKSLQDQAFEQFLAYAYIENADQTKYRSILSGLTTQQSLGNDQYPKTITEANNVLSNHKFDAFKQGNKFHNKTSNEPAKQESEQQKVTLSFAQMEGMCYCCGKPGHK